MKVLKANQDQYNALNGYTNKNHVLQFVKDADNNWIVGKEVLLDDNFIAIRSQLKELQEIEYNPIIVDL